MKERRDVGERGNKHSEYSEVPGTVYNTIHLVGPQSHYSHYSYYIEKETKDTRS